MELSSPLKYILKMLFLKKKKEEKNRKKKVYPHSHVMWHWEFHFTICTTNQPLICALLSHFLVLFLLDRTPGM